MVAPVPAHISELPRRKPSCPSRRSTPNSCHLILLQTLLHSQSRQPLWNQANPNSFAKTPAIPVSPTHYSLPTTHSLLTTFRMNAYVKGRQGGVPPAKPWFSDSVPDAREPYDAWNRRTPKGHLRETFPRTRSYIKASTCRERTWKPRLLEGPVREGEISP